MTNLFRFSYAPHDNTRLEYRGRWPIRLLRRVAATVGAATVVAILTLGLESMTSDAAVGPAAGLSFGTESCQPDGTVSGSLIWTPSGLGSQYVDLALDAAFTRFNTGGPYAANTASVDLAGLTQGSTYFVLVRTEIGSESLPSEVLRVTVGTCPGGPLAQSVSSLRLVSLHSDKCLEIYGLSEANFAPASQWECWDGPNQTIQATRLTDGYYEFRFAHSDKCLEVTNWNVSNGNPISQYACHGGDNQRWSPTLVGGTYSLMRNKFSGKCLDVYAWAHGNGERIVQWDCHGGANQQWRSVVRDDTPTAGPLIAITIDTDTVRAYMPQMLDILDAHGVTASFGVTGEWAVRNPDLVRRMVASHHTVMNHSWSHPSFVAISSAARQEQIRWADEAIQQIAGVSTKPYFRPPYGNTSADIRADAAAVGHRVILWSVDPQGWRGYSGKTITSHILSHAFNGAVVLMHSTTAGDLEALGPTIEGLRSLGYRFVTIDELYP